MIKCKILVLLVALFVEGQLYSQNMYELNSDWVCLPASETNETGNTLSLPSYKLKKQIPATVPGTILTTLFNNKLVPDPFYGMNNQKIQDIYDVGRDYYTYWFIKDFNEKKTDSGEQVWLHLRGVNYGCDVYLNGKKLNDRTHFGMFLRQVYNITPFLSVDGRNRLAIIVYPPDPVGNPNGGQGGDGTIAKNVVNQYVAGWDWIQPIRDRNTGIWDKVYIEKTLGINLQNPHFITQVSGTRFPGSPQAPAVVKASVEIENPLNNQVRGIVQYTLDGIIIRKEVTIAPNSSSEIQLPDLILNNPQLWWPNGYGEQYLYPVRIEFLDLKGQCIDHEGLQLGIREIQTKWNAHTRSMQVHVNGQKIFIKGGNWIISDAMLRFSEERYDAEIRFHRDMNLNLIRIWGGAIVERPEFFNACDKYGLLVFQDLWMTGDCNGRWMDPSKKDDQWIRRQYPDDHQLFIQSVSDQVKMIRNHPSLAFYCGGNEIMPPENIYKVLKDSIFPKIDNSRYFFSYSNSDSMSYNFLGGTGDGPYHIQPHRVFWETRTFPFNSEVGSVGTGDYESLQRFIPKENLVVPDYSLNKVDSVWQYHKDIGYGSYIDSYGKPADIKDFALKAQLVNFDQYRALIEGFSSHAWDWYTGVIIWKTQNPWTALRGQMYDYYLDPNACLYGLRSASEPLHIMCNPVTGMLIGVNNTFQYYHDMFVQAKIYSFAGKESLINQVYTEISPTSVQNYFSVQGTLDDLRKKGGGFLVVRFINSQKEIVSSNLYWIADSLGSYQGLQKMPEANLSGSAKLIKAGKIEVNLANPHQSAVAFFVRLSLVDKNTKKRILPVFYSDNYVSVLPGETKKLTIEYSPKNVNGKAEVSLEGWNVKEQCFDF